MARPLPTAQEVLDIRHDLLEYLADDDLDTLSTRALAKVKIDLEDQRGGSVLWSQVWDADHNKYFVGYAGNTRNDGKIPRMIAYLDVSMTFRDYSIQNAEEDKWWGLAEYYMEQYEKMILTAKLDVDSDDSGTISEDEDARTGQVFLNR